MLEKIGASDRNFDEKPLLLEVDNRLYDVAKFAKRHPGGEKVLRRVAGQAVDELMKGTKRFMGVKHAHSQAAYRMLKKYIVDGDDDLTSDPIDISKAVLSQVGGLHQRYWTWTHQPLDRDLRLFQSDYLEMLTRTHWLAIPIIWMPLVLVFGFLGLTLLSDIYGLVYGGGIWALLFGLGSLVWSLLEYVLHRFVFHWVPNCESERQIVVHFLIHGLHHKV